MASSTTPPHESLIRSAKSGPRPRPLVCYLKGIIYGGVRIMEGSQVFEDDERVRAGLIQLLTYWSWRNNWSIRIDCQRCSRRQTWPKASTSRNCLGQCRRHNNADEFPSCCLWHYSRIHSGCGSSYSRCCWTLDTLSWRRVCTAFGQKFNDLCASLAWARRISTTFVNPSTLLAYTSCRLIPLDKCPGSVRL